MPVAEKLKTFLDLRGIDHEVLVHPLTHSSMETAQAAHIKGRKLAKGVVVRDDRGYLLELFVCQNGNLLWWTDSYEDQFTTSYEVRDEPGCGTPSSGKLYTVEKHGFSDPVEIPWPQPQ